MVQCLGLLKMTSLSWLSKYPIILQVSANRTKSNFTLISGDIRLFCKKTFKGFYWYSNACNLIWVTITLSLYFFLVSAFYAENFSKQITFNAHIWTKSKFLGLSVGVENIGQGNVSKSGSYTVIVKTPFRIFKAPDFLTLCSLTACDQ